MKSQIHIQIPIEHSDLYLDSTLYSDGNKWSVKIENDMATLLSNKNYEVPVDKVDENWLDADTKLNQTIHKTIGHFRNCVYFSFGQTMEWGFEAWYGTTHSVDTLGLFPSIHQTGVSTKFDKSVLDIGIKIFADVANTRDRPAKTMMSYWRRGQELSDLSFHSESFLNFFKVLECLEQLNLNSQSKSDMLDRFAPIDTSKPGKKRLPLKYIRRHVGKYPKDSSVVGHIDKIAKMLATSNASSKISGSSLVFLLDIVHARNHYNVGHKLMRENKFDTFMGIGQHSDEFEHVIPNLHNIETLSKMFILNYLFPKKYEYDNKKHHWKLKNDK